MTVDIAVLAQREARAEASKGKADAAWRSAWWATTLALGQITGKRAVGEAQAIIRETTGQKQDWVWKRTRTGRAFAGLGASETLPPRMAVEIVQAGIEVTESLAQQMIQAERDSVSLRDFTAGLTGKAWADTPEGASEATIEQIVKAQPERVGRAVAREPVAREAVHQETRRRYAQQAQEAGLREPEPMKGALMSEAVTIRTHIDNQTEDLMSLLRRAEPDERQQITDYVRPGYEKGLRVCQLGGAKIPDDLSELEDMT